LSSTLATGAFGQYGNPTALRTFFVHDYATDEDCKHDRRKHQECTIHDSLLSFVPKAQTWRFLALFLKNALDASTSISGM
jgi:hypothetical protein